jgi:hypothetical protein
MGCAERRQLRVPGSVSAIAWACVYRGIMGICLIDRTVERRGIS